MKAKHIVIMLLGFLLGWMLTHSIIVYDKQMFLAVIAVIVLLILAVCMKE